MYCVVIPTCILLEALALGDGVRFHWNAVPLNLARMRSTLGCFCAEYTVLKRFNL